MTDPIYHFTCDHGHQGIGPYGLVLPNWHPFVGATLSWFTDDPRPERDAIGLTSETGLFNCDRLQYRYVVTDDQAHLKLRRWLYSKEQAQTDPHAQADLHRFSDPATWWISTDPVFITLDPPPNRV